MAAAPPARSASPMPAPPTPKRRNTSDGSSNGATGLRNSCESCASSKVKCSGRKPICHRCEKRGFECEYIQAKRAGRKPAGSTSAANAGTAASSHTDTDAGPSRDVAAVSDTAYASPRGTASELSDIWADLNPLDRSLFSELSNVNETSSGFTPSFPLELPAFDAVAPTAPMTSADNLYSSTIDSGLDLGMGTLSDAGIEARNDAAADLFAFPTSTPRATGLATPVTRESQSLQRSPTTTQPCSCLVQALGLMKRLSELLSATGVMGSAKSDVDAIRTIQDILGQNQSAIEAATGMLNCPGRHDGYLLIIICLAAFKTLELFTAIVPEVPTPQTPQTRRMSVMSSSNPARTITSNGDGYHIEGEDWARQSTQAILSELHSVRSLTKLLSEKLRIQTMATTAGSSTTTMPSSTSTSTPDGSEGKQSLFREIAAVESEARLPFSAEVYRQLDVDLANRVKTLSQQIISRLRSF